MRYLYFFIGLVLLFAVYFFINHQQKIFKYDYLTDYHLPKDLRQQLDDAGFRFRTADKTDYPKNFSSWYSDAHGLPWAYGVLAADYNGDTLQDYAFILVEEGHYRWFAALKNPPENQLPYQIFDLGLPRIPQNDDRELAVVTRTNHASRRIGGVFTLTRPNTLYRSFDGKNKLYNPFYSFGIVSEGEAMYWYYTTDGKWKFFTYIR